MALATASHGGNRKEQVTKPHYPSLSSGQSTPVASRQLWTRLYLS